jgi:hypothetical protein
VSVTTFVVSPTALLSTGLTGTTTESAGPFTSGCAVLPPPQDIKLTLTKIINIAFFINKIIFVFFIDGDLKKFIKKIYFLQT